MGRGPVRVGDELAEVVGRMADPPSAPLAERAVLGSVMLWPAVADRLLPFTYDHYFSHPFHREVLASVKRLHARRSPTDPTAVLTDLHARGVRHVGTRDAGVVLHDLLVAAWTPEAGAHHLAVLCEYAARRRVVEAGVRMIQQAQHGDSDLPTLMRAAGGGVRADPRGGEPARPGAAPGLRDRLPTAGDRGEDDPDRRLDSVPGGGAPGRVSAGQGRSEAPERGELRRIGPARATRGTDVGWGRDDDGPEIAS